MELKLKVENRKTKKEKTDMLRSIDNETVWGIRGVSPEEEKEGYSGKDLQKRKVLSLEWKNEGVLDDESGESMEPMLQVPLEGLGESELERLVLDWWRDARSCFQRRGEA